LEERCEKMKRTEELQSNHVTGSTRRHFRPTPAALKKLATYKSRRRTENGWEEQNTDRRRGKNKEKRGDAVLYESTYFVQLRRRRNTCETVATALQKPT
jgi:hypothetical protein